VIIRKFDGLLLKRRFNLMDDGIVYLGRELIGVEDGGERIFLIVFH
jgi:hypothetical protein